MLMLGPVSWIMPIAVALSTFGALNGCVFTAARQCLVASRYRGVYRILIIKG